MPPRVNNVIKIACTRDGKIPILLEFDQARGLDEIVASICSQWALENAHKYALRTDVSGKYITDMNRHELKDGAVLKLSQSPTELAMSVLTNVNARGNPNLRRDALRSIKAETEDPAFAEAFIKLSGLSILFRIIDQELTDGTEETILGYSISSVTATFTHGIMNWTDISDAFVVQMASIVHREAGSAVRAGLRFLVSILARDSSRYDIICSKTDYRALIAHIRSADSVVQENAIALINAFIIYAATPDVQKEVYRRLESEKLFESLQDRVINGRADIAPNLARELAIFQHLHFRKLTVRLYEPVGLNDHTSQLLNVLCMSYPDYSSDVTKVAGSEVERATAILAKLGIRNVRTLDEETPCPPGILALEYMADFARRYNDIFVHLIHEQLKLPESFKCDFFKVSIDVLLLIVDVFGISRQAVTTRTTYIPALFTSREPVKELFAIAVQLVFKNWSEMKANEQDRRQVLTITRHQLMELVKVPQSSLPEGLEPLKTLVFSKSFGDVIKTELDLLRDLESSQLQSESVQRLIKTLTSEATELVRAKRVAYLQHGEFFHILNKAKTKREPARFYCILSSNSKTIHYSEPVAESYNQRPNLTQLHMHFLVEDIKCVLTPREMTSINAKKLEPELVSRIFGVVVGSEMQCVEFVAPSPETAEIWMDGFRVLINKPMEEKSSAEQVALLLDLQMNLRSLDMQGVVFDGKSPHVPDLPIDTSFFYNEL